MNNTTLIALVLVGAVVVGAVYLMTSDNAPIVLGGGAAAPAFDPNRPEATYYIDSIGTALGGVLGGVGSIVTAAYGGGGGDK